MKTAPTKEDVTLKAQFSKWIASKTVEPLICQLDNDHLYIVRVAKDADFDYLFLQRDYFGQGIRREELQYGGIFCQSDGLVYDAQYNLRFLDEMQDYSALKLLHTLMAQVCGAVEAAINNDRKSLNITKLSKRRAEELANFVQFAAAEVAREAYVYGEDGRFVFRCDFTLVGWEDTQLLDYIRDPATFVQRTVDQYISEKQEVILKTFLKNDALRKEYQDIAGNPNHQAHVVKRIVEAAQSVPAKTLRVTILRDGQELTFTVEADELCRDRKEYLTCYIAAADRRAFEQLFGKSDGCRPEEITRITYGRAVLYEA